MPRAVATIADVNQFDPNPRHILTVACCMKPKMGTAENFPVEKKELQVVLEDTMNATQINAAVVTAIKAHATAMGLTIADADIMVPKYS